MTVRRNRAIGMQGVSSIVATVRWGKGCTICPWNDVARVEETYHKENELLMG